MHRIPIARYLGKGIFVLERLWGELLSENEVLEIPMAMKWLANLADIKRRVEQSQITASSVTFIV